MGRYAEDVGNMGRWPVPRVVGGCGIGRVCAGGQELPGLSVTLWHGAAQRDECKARVGGISCRAPRPRASGVTWWLSWGSTGRQARRWVQEKPAVRSVGCAKLVLCAASPPSGWGRLQ